MVSLLSLTGNWQRATFIANFAAEGFRKLPQNALTPSPDGKLGGGRPLCHVRHRCQPGTNVHNFMHEIEAFEEIDEFSLKPSSHIAKLCKIGKLPIVTLTTLPPFMPIHTGAS